MVSRSGQCLVVSESQSLLSLLHSLPDLRLLCVCTARQSLRGFSVQVTARVAGMRVHMYNCAPACAVTRRSWSYLSCLHVLRSVSAAADPPFSSSSAQLSWTCRAPPACVVVLLRGARYCTRCVLLVAVIVCKSCGALSRPGSPWCPLGCC